jgi:hypothetical protein
MQSSHAFSTTGESGKRMFKRVAQTPPEVVNFVNFLRQYIEQANK